MATPSWDDAYAASGDAAFRATVNSAVRRILDGKQAYHLMPCRRF